jgi:hypothetical protein
VYVILAVTVIATLDPVNDPGFQVYVDAPKADSVAVDPIQIVVGVEDAVIVGVTPTLIVNVRVVVQAPVLPVTV